MAKDPAMKSTIIWWRNFQNALRGLRVEGVIKPEMTVKELQWMCTDKLNELEEKN